MTIHKIERPTIPDMRAVRKDIEKALDRVEMLMSSMEFIHHVDQDLLQSAHCTMAATRKALLLSMVPKGEKK